MAPSHRGLVPASTSETVTTSFLLGNLHCPTCVSTIKTALAESCGSLVKWVSPNVVTSVVTVEHAPEASLRQMRKALEESGFEVCGVATSAGDIRDLDLEADEGAGAATDHPPSALSRWLTPSSSHASQTHKAQAHLENCEQCRSVMGTEPGETRVLEAASHHANLALPKPSGSSPQTSASPESFIVVESADSPPQPLWRATLAVGGMTCAACANMITEGLGRHDWVSNVAVNLLGNSATVDLRDKEKAGELVQAIEDLGYEATLDAVTDLNQGKRKGSGDSDTWRATLAVGGMTCASCANNITREMKRKDWVKDITVNLLTNSATVDVKGRANADKLVEAIEDLGYDAAINTVVSLADQEAAEEHERSVEIRIDGLHCEHCPDRVTKSLAGFRRRLEVVAQPTLHRPIMKISYVPDAPSFTIRQILAAIEASDPGFTATIYHPPSLEERSKQIQRKHQLQILWRVIFTAIVCIPTFVIGIVYMSLLPDGESKRFITAPWTSGISRAQMALFIMATPVYFFAADLFHRRAIKEIKTLWRPGSRVPIPQRFYRFGSMNTLMSLGTTIAYVSSVSQLIAAAVRQPTEMDDSDFYFDSVVFLTFFLLLGRLIESYSKSRTGDAVEMLGKLRPTTAILVEGHGSEKEKDVVVKADLLDFGDVVRVPHGASPPADGTVVDGGQSSFDESSLTGESRLVKKAPGDDVFSGTVNKDRSILMHITGAAGRSMLDQIVQVVREGQTKRAPIEQVADLLTSYFVPVVTLIAVLTWIIWLSLGLSNRIPEHYLDVSSGGWVAFSLQFAIAVFVVACPCGLALAAPTAIFVGSGLAAKHGILAKGGGEAFEKASRIDCVVFDKTGTLTMGGEPSITDSEVYAQDDGANSKDTLLAALKAVEENSSHPIAKAIVAFCATQTSAKASIDALQEVPGKGMKAVYPGSGPNEAFALAVGNESLMSDLSVPIPPQTAQTLQKWKSEAKSVALVATKPLQTPPQSPSPSTTPWTLAAVLAISDPIRPEAPRIIRALHARGTRVWMLSGDNPTTAAAVAARLGIPPDQVLAGVLPTGKADKIKYLQTTLKAVRHTRTSTTTTTTTRRATVAMVGDGINDSPALATADVGVAVGSGADVAIGSADFVLVKSDLRAVVDLLDLSAAVFGRIKLNFGWAVVYNCLALPVAAGVFYPIVSRGSHVRLDPVWASLAMALSSISVVLSSLALRSRVRGVGFRERRIEGL